MSSKQQSTQPTESATPQPKEFIRREALSSLYAYAKADELLSKFEWAEIESEKGRVAKGEFEAQLRSMGWDGDGSRLAFLQTYRAAALAQAEGKQ